MEKEKEGCYYAKQKKSFNVVASDEQLNLVFISIWARWLILRLHLVS
jgi:hypothetical protein